ncbi:MAG: hypothetical protein ACYTGG_01945 [Planctomycetota bacterium]|jgi:hypothetical protein
MSPLRHASRPAIVGLALAIAGPLGCASASKDEPALREISLAEFSRPQPSPTVSQDGDPAGDSTGAATVATDETRLDLGGPVGEGVVGPDRPIPLQASNMPAAEPLPMEPGEAVIIDRMVGQINGRPVYADAFFEEIEDELRAKAEELPPAEYAQEVAEIVSDHLREEVLNALYLAEAESRLTPPQQQGLLGMLGQVRERIVAGHRGSSILASETLESEQEMSLEEAVSDWKERMLIYNLLNENVLGRVIVSWRDIEREYERRAREFNPAPKIVLARIRLNTARAAEQIAAIKQRLEDGETFEAVATSVGQWEDGRWQSFALGPEGISGIQLNDRMRTRLESLEVGQTTDAFELGSSTWWIHYTALEQDEGRSLYDADVQRALDAEIRARRLAEEQARYIRSLLEQGIFDELDAMAARLIDIALARYAAD